MSRPGFALRLSLLTGCVFCFAQTGFASIPTPSKTHRLNRLGRVQVGDSIDTLPSIAQERARIHLGQRRHRFHVYFFAPELPAKCLNLQCGKFARQVMSQGGFLVGGGDRHYAQEVGTDQASESMILVTDRADKVVAIYEDASSTDLKRIVAAIK